MAKKKTPLEAEAFTEWMHALADRKSRKRVPAWLDLASLPPLHDGANNLAEPVLVGLVKLLAEDGGSRDTLVKSLRDWAAPKACGAFAKTLLTTWKARKFQKANEWLLAAAMALAEDVTAKPLLSLARSFRKKTARHAKVPLILQGVADIGTDTALRELIQLSRSHEEFTAQVDTVLEGVAGKRGTSLPNLVEGLLPAEDFLLGLDKPKALPSILKKHGVPQLVARDGELVGKTYHLAVVRALVEGDGTWRLVRHAVEAKVDPKSAADFALALLGAWVAEDFHGRYSWIGGALGAFGDDRVAFALKPHLQKLSHRKASDGDRQKAMSLMSVFGQIGTDSALLVLIGLGQANTRPSVFSAGWGVINQAAARRGISADQLEDRVAPDCGLDEHGGRVFDYGPRQFKLLFDEDFRPRLAHPDGDMLSELPGAEAGDDVGQVESCQAAWALMSRQLEEILDIQTERLRRSMVQERHWSIADWRTWIMGHPLMVNYAQRLVWGLHDAESTLLATFRAAEDRTLVDIEDEAVELGGDHATQTITLTHPAGLTSELRRAWGDHFADYEILQPFHQLGRPVFAPSDTEKNATELHRWAHTKVPARRLYESLLGRGWDRDGGYGRRIYFTKAFPKHKLQALVKMDPGYDAGGVDWAGPQTVPEVWFSTDVKGRQYDDEGIDKQTLGDVEPVAFSEVVVDVAAAFGDDEDEHAKRVSG